MKLGINFKEVAMKAGGHTAGAALAGKISNISFIKNMTNPVARGLVMAGIGYVAIPMITKKAGLSGGKKGNFMEAVGEGVGVVGILQAAHSKFPNVFPAIAVAGVEGYEENPIQGLGMIADVEAVSGYEENPINGVGNSMNSGDADASE